MFATVGQSDASLFAVLARVAGRSMADFTVHELANIAWAFAKASQSDASLFTVLAKAGERRAWDLNMQDLTNLACT